jgi:putative ABC transport system permease protein
MYPALIVSGFSPILALKNKINSSTVGGISLRRSLVVLQFCISQVLIVGTLIAITQMSFVAHANLGLNKDAVLVINGNGDSTQTSRMNAFKAGLLKIPSVKSVSLSTDVPSSENNWGSNFAFNHKPDENFTLYLKYADPDYFKTFGLQFAAGGPPRLSDTLGDVVVNETFIHKTGLKNPEDAIGKDVRIGSSAWKKISGVVRDFRTNSLREGIRPTLIGCAKKYYSTISLKLKTSNPALVRQQVQQIWDRFYPEYANQTSFMDEHLEDFYQQERQLTLLYKIFAGIAIFLSCLGLYGLVSFMAVQKRKEVGIRKVLGAGIMQIIYLFSKEFTFLILIAFIIAAPISWYMMNGWLHHFTYRITVSPFIFIAAALISITIAWVTVGYKSFRAALTNPVNSLRSE